MIQPTQAELVPPSYLGPFAILAFVICTTTWTYVWLGGGTKIFRFVQSMILGALAGQFLSISLDSLNIMAVTPLITGTNTLMIFPILLGLLLLTSFMGHRYNWIARYPTAIMGGVGLGVVLRKVLDAQFIEQIIITMKPVYTPDPMTSLSNIVYIFCAVISLFYFVFGFRLEGPWQRLNDIGKYVILLAFGIKMAGNLYVIGGETEYGVQSYITWWYYLQDFFNWIRGGLWI